MVDNPEKNGARTNTLAYFHHRQRRRKSFISSTSKDFVEKENRWRIYFELSPQGEKAGESKIP